MLNIIVNHPAIFLFFITYFNITYCTEFIILSFILYPHNMDLSNLSKTVSKMKKITEDVHMDLSSPQGKGSFGAVYKGYHSEKQQIIAIKFIHNKTMKNKEQQFLREIMVYQNLSNCNHSNILTYYGYQHNKEGLFMFFQFCSGGDLNKHIPYGLSENRITEIFMQILEGMIFLASQNIIHRDLKPSNIFITEYDIVKIGDLGSARQAAQQMTAGNLRCSPLYAPPEFLLSKNNSVYDERCDVWSAGLILYEMLAKKHLFYVIQNKEPKQFTQKDLGSAIHKFKNENFVIRMPSNLKQDWGKLIRQMLIYDYEKRPNFKKVKEKFYTLKSQIAKDSLTESQREDFLKVSHNILKIANPFTPVKVVKEPRSIIETGYDLETKKVESYSLLNKIIQFIAFYNEKCDIFLLLVEKFKAQYELLHNVYKWLLMFCSIVIYILKTQKLLRMLQKKQFTIEGQKISITSFERQHKELFQNLIEESTVMKEKPMQKAKKTLHKIEKKLLNCYMERQKQRSMLEEMPDYLELVRNAKKNCFLSESDYMQKYRELAKVKSYHQAQKRTFFGQSELRTYTIVHLISKVDILFGQDKKNNHDSIKQQLDKIEKGNFQILLEFNKRLQNIN